MERVAESGRRIELLLSSEAETREVAADWAQEAEGGELLVLDGELGAGKTTFVRGFAQGLGCDPRHVKSPSYVLHHRHEGRRVLHHLDVYFTESTLDLERTPILAYLQEGDVVALEWGRRIASWLPEDHLAVELEHESEAGRKGIFIAHGPRSEAWMGRFLRRRPAR